MQSEGPTYALVQWNELVGRSEQQRDRDDGDQLAISVSVSAPNLAVAGTDCASRRSYARTEQPMNSTLQHLHKVHMLFGFFGDAAYQFMIPVQLAGC